jgi:hypothetical protein
MARPPGGSGRPFMWPDRQQSNDKGVIQQWTSSNPIRTCSISRATWTPRSLSVEGTDPQRCSLVLVKEVALAEFSPKGAASF